jgi:uncharacterized protein
MKLAEVHKFKLRGRTVLLDVSSSSLFQIDAVTDQILDSLRAPSDLSDLRGLESKYGPETVEQALADLREVGVILAEEPDIRSRPCPEECEITNLALNVSHHCNLRCRYCYGDGGSYGGKRQYMDGPIARAAVDLLMRQSGGKSRCSILFFGGEPLMNLDVIGTCLQYGRLKAREQDKRLTFSVVTNGTLLTDEVLDYLDENGVWIEVSMDGTREIHDAMRVFPNGKGSYDAVIPGVNRLVSRRPGIVPARVTVTNQSLEFMDAVLHLLSLGFGSVAIDLVSGNDEEWSLDSDDLRVIEREYRKAAEYLLQKLKRGERFELSSLTEIIEAMLLPEKRHYHCGCGKSYIAVSPTGDIYACHRFVGDDRFLMGNVRDGLDKHVQRRFLRNNVDSREACRTCWARYFCGGGCNYQAVLATGDISAPDSSRCSIIKRTIELCMMIYCEVRRDNRPVLDRAAELVKRRRSYKNSV